MDNRADIGGDDAKDWILRAARAVSGYLGNFPSPKSSLTFTKSQAMKFMEPPTEAGALKFVLEKMSPLWL